MSCCAIKNNLMKNTRFYINTEVLYLKSDLTNFRDMCILKAFLSKSWEPDFLT